MALELVGVPNIEHVAQPDGTEQCFPAIVAAMSGASVDEAHLALMARGLSEEDGTTTNSLPKKTDLEVAGLVLPIERFQSPFEGFEVEKPEDAEGVLEAIDAQLVAVRGVALLHRKNDSPSDDRHHWTLFTSYYNDNGEKGAIRAIDPLQKHAGYLPRPQVAAIIERTIRYDGTVFAYAITPPEPRSGLYPQDS